MRIFSLASALLLTLEVASAEQIVVTNDAVNEWEPKTLDLESFNELVIDLNLVGG